MKTFNVNVRAVRFLTATVSITAENRFEAEKKARAHVKSADWPDDGWDESDPEDLEVESVDEANG